MGPVVLTFIGLAATVALVIYLVSRWAINYVQRVMGERAEAVEAIVNQERVPAAWIKRYVTKIDRIRDQPNSQAVIARYISLAQKRCIANLDELIRFSEEVNYADGDDTRRSLLAALRAQRKRWNDVAFWDEVFS